MGILDDIRAEVRGPGTVCKAGAFIATMTPEQRDAIRAALTEGIEKSAIGRWVIKQGFTQGPESVTRHIAGRCKCPS